MILMKKREPIFFLLTLFFLFQSHVFAAKKSYVVYLGEHSHGPEPTEADFDRAKASHHDLLASTVGSLESAKEVITHSYTKHINGFAANLEEEEAEALAKDPNVISVFPNKGKQLHTTHSMKFLGLETSGGTVLPHTLWNKTRYGEDLIIGVIDTGVWPESESFSDEGYGPIPSRWKGKCQNDTKDAFSCNRKLIGARYFNRDLIHMQGPLPPSMAFHSARDYDGHGTHTLSTAGGNFVAGANVFGFANGTAKGGSPKARLASYKTCWPDLAETAGKSGRCLDADIMAAFDAAIHDGVDVISVSFGAQFDYLFKDAASIGALHAVKKGIIVVGSAGNNGPGPATVSNESPWVLTVAASTIDREFASYVILGNKKRIRGTSLSLKSLPQEGFYPLISGIEAKATRNATKAELCMPESLDPEKVKGKILVCLHGENYNMEKSLVAHDAGAVGMILMNDVAKGNYKETDNHYVPSSHISYTDGLAVLSYINSTEPPMASITKVTTELDTKPAPFVATFSSRGPNYHGAEILKPDITAPGVRILAAFTKAPNPNADYFADEGTPSFQLMSGTSMSCPHVAGIAGLLKIIHPDWSPAAIKSAIMTTAKTRANNGRPMQNPLNEKDTPFDYGAGHIRPNHAMDPGLVYDLTMNDYYDYLCGVSFKQSTINKLSNQVYNCPETFDAPKLNYPAISIPSLGDSYTVTRRVKNVGSPGTYNVTVHEPMGIAVTVKPNSLSFEKIGEEKKFTVNLKPKYDGAARDFMFGSLKWSDGKHNVRIPIIVKTGKLGERRIRGGMEEVISVVYSDTE